MEMLGRNETMGCYCFLLDFSFSALFTNVHTKTMSDTVEITTPTTQVEVEVKQTDNEGK